MKYKNFQFNKSLLTRLLAGTIALVVSSTAVSGWSNKNTDPLEGTLLEGYVIVTLNDGKKEVAITKYECNSGFGHHYINPTTGEEFADIECRHQPVIQMRYKHIIQKYHIEGEESIALYLTEEEIKMLQDGELSDEQISNLIVRSLAESINRDAMEEETETEETSEAYTRKYTKG